MIEESEALDLKNAVALHQELTDFFGDSARVALMHGRMKNDEKDQIMQDFKDKKISDFSINYSYRSGGLTCQMLRLWSLWMPTALDLASFTNFVDV